jgi:hypothetical protein
MRVFEVARFFRQPSELFGNCVSFLYNLRSASLFGESPLPASRFVNSDLSECMWLTQSLDLMLESSGRNFSVVMPLSHKILLMQRQLEGTEEQQRFEVTVSRDQIVHDGMERIAAASAADLRRPLAVAFREETGVDAGGLSREFFRLLCIGLAEDTGMLTRLESGEYWLNAASRDQNFEALGRVVALAALNGATLPISFVAVLYKKLCKQALRLSDVGLISRELLAGLLSLRDMGDTVGEAGIVYTAGDHELIE